MPVKESRTLRNASDTARTWPLAALAPRVLPALEGLIFKRFVAGPGIGAEVEFDEPIVDVALALRVNEGTGAFGTPNVPQKTTNYTVTPKNANGKGALVGVTDLSTTALYVLFSPDRPDGTTSGQATSSAEPI